jgi:hypothetical protein
VSAEFVFFSCPLTYIIISEDVRVVNPFLCKDLVKLRAGA